MIDISRIEAGKPLQLEKEPVFLDELVGESVRSAAHTFREKEIKIEISVPKKGFSFLADRKKLLRVMANLLGNALKFTPGGGAVTISVKSEKDRLLVTVADTGIGVAPQYLAKIFDKFFQIDSSYTRATGGIGMGLTIASDIIKAHGGKIWVESPGLGQGTTIIFTLPISG